MLGRRLYRAGVRGWHVHVLSLVFVAYCLGLWIRAKAVDQSQRARRTTCAVRGVWPPTLWVIGDAIERFRH